MNSLPFMVVGCSLAIAMMSQTVSNTKSLHIEVHNPSDHTLVLMPTSEHTNTPVRVEGYHWDEVKGKWRVRRVWLTPEIFEKDLVEPE